MLLNENMKQVLPVPSIFLFKGCLVYVLILYQRKKETLQSHWHVILYKYIVSEMYNIFSYIIPNQRCKLVTFQIDTWKVIGYSTLLPPYAMPVLIMDYSTRHHCIYSAILSPCKMPE